MHEGSLPIPPSKARIYFGHENNGWQLPLDKSPPRDSLRLRIMHHPRLADLIYIAHLAWPFALIILKIIFRQIKWRWLWLTVPIVSWITINAADWVDPQNGPAGVFARTVNLWIGWFFMIPLFGILCLGFLAVEMLIKKLEKKSASSLTSTGK
jgi:hypothetical protein